MKRIVSAVLSFALILSMGIPVLADGHVEVTEYAGAMDISMKVVGHYNSGTGEGGTEIVAFAKNAGKMFVVNGQEKALDIVDISGLVSGSMLDVKSSARIGLDDLEGVASAKDITSVAVAPDESFVAVAVPADPKQDPGSLVLVDIDGGHIATYTVGALPDMVKITPDSNYILVANEGEPNDDYTVDPEGSVTIIDVAAGQVTNVMFDDESIIDASVRKSNPDASYAQNLEPEYIDVNEDGTMAYVVCQESNALAVLDVKAMTFTKVYDLGVKDYSVAGNEIDASNKDDEIKMANYPVLSLYQPDGIDVVTISGKTYLFTANEGDAQDYDGYSEESRVADESSMMMLDAANYAGYTQEELDAAVEAGLYEDDQLGRLKMTTANGKNADGMYTAIYGYGGRSFSIFDTSDMSLVYDSGNLMEKVTAEVSPEYFNTTDDELAFDDRSDDKGPEPENVVVGMVAGKPYAFVGLERFGGIMAFDVSNPAAPEFELYTTTRKFDETMGGDLAPEGMAFVEAMDSPTGNPLLLVANEVSGTAVIYEISEVAMMEEAPAMPTEEMSDAADEGMMTYGTYTVVEGDVLWKIADKYDTSYEKLAEINDLSNPNMIYIGQVLNVPAK